MVVTHSPSEMPLLAEGADDMSWFIAHRKRCRLEAISIAMDGQSHLRGPLWMRFGRISRFRTDIDGEIARALYLDLH